MRCWQTRYLIINSEGVIYKRHHLSEDIRENLQFDHQFQMIYDPEQTRIRFGIILKYTNRTLKIRAFDAFDFIVIVYNLKRALLTSPYTNL